MWSSAAVSGKTGGGLRGHEGRRLRVVLEKMPTPGCKSIITAASCRRRVPTPGRRRGSGFPRSCSEDMLKAGLNLNHVNWPRWWADSPSSTVMWTISELGSST